MSAGGAPYGPLRGRGWVAAVPWVWCVAFSAIGGLEIAHRAIDAGLSGWVAALRGAATMVVVASKVLALTVVFTRERSLLLRIFSGGCVLGFSNLLFPLTSASTASHVRVATEPRFDVQLGIANEMLQPFFGVSALLLLVATTIELPFFGAARRLARHESAEAIDEELVVFGVGTVVHALAFRALVDAHVDVAIALAIVAVAGTGLAKLGQTRRVARRRWLREIAADSDAEWTLRAVDGSAGPARESVPLIVEGKALFGVFANEARQPGYRSAMHGAEEPVAHVFAEADDRARAQIGRTPSVLALFIAALRAAVFEWGADTVETRGKPWVSDDMRRTLGCLGAVVVVGAAFMAYGTWRFLAHTHMAEATRNLSQIETGLRKVAHERHAFPRSSEPIPSTVPRAPIVVPDADWQKPPWTDLDFKIVEPHRYQYELQTSPDGKHCFARARGDLDGDGVTSLFELEEKIGANGEAERAVLRITNEDE